MPAVPRRRFVWICLAAAALAAGVGVWRAPPGPADSGEPRHAAPAPRNAVLTAPLPAPQGTLSLRGRVLGPDGAVAQAAIIATGPGGEDLSKLPSGCKGDDSGNLLGGTCAKAARKLAEIAEQRWGEAPAVARGLTRPDGTFELTGLAEGTVTLWAESAGRGIALLEGVKAGAEGVELRLQPGTVLSGKVVGDTDEPLPGAAVTALPGAHRRYFDGQSGPDGRFLIGPVPPGDYTVVAALEGRVPAAAAVSESEPPTLQLFTPRRVAGVVVRDGRGVSGARVEATSESEVVETTADAQGHFELASLRPDTYQLVATSAGDRGAEWVKLAPGADLDGVEVPLSEGAEISGEAVDDQGQPLARAAVHADGDSAEETVVETGPDGRFQIGPLAPGGYTLFALAKGHLPAEAVRVRLAPGDHREQKLALRAGVSLRGLVVDPEGKPVAGASVIATALRQRFGGSGAESGEDGSFELDSLERGEYEVTVAHPRFQMLVTHAEAPGAQLKLALARGGSIDVRVVDERGAPVPGASVDFALGASDPDGDGTRDISGNQTDGEGRLLLEGLQSGSYRVSARTTSSVSRHGSTPVEVREGATAVARVALRVGRVLQGVVVDPGGAPLSGASVQAALRGEANEDAPPCEGGQQVADAETGLDGHFEMQDLCEGHYQLWATKDGFNLDDSTEQVAEAGAREPVRLVLHPEKQLRLRVLREDGRRLSSFEIDGVPQSAPDGEAILSMPEAFEPHVVSAVGYVPVRVIIDPEKSAQNPVEEVVLHPGRRVSGRVVTARTGEPVPDAEIQVLADDVGAEEVGGRLDARSGPGGEFTLSHVEDGCVIAVHKSGFRTTTRMLGAGDGTVTVELAALSTLKGVVVGNGHSVEGMVVALRGPSSPTTTVDAQGAFEFTDLLDGEYTVSVWREDPNLSSRLALDQVHVTVPPSDIARVELHPRLDGVRLVVRFGAPVESGGFTAPVLMPGHFEPPASPLERYGAFEDRGIPAMPGAQPDELVFEPVPPGHYTLEVPLDGPSERVFSQELDVRPGGEQILDVRLPAEPPSRP